MNSQYYLDEISQWTKDQKMMINKKKCKTMFFNFTKNYQFSSWLKIDNEIVETVQEMKLLGTTITNDLMRSANTKNIVKQINQEWN